MEFGIYTGGIKNELILDKMKKYHSIFLLFAFILFCNASCEEKEKQSLIIQNNSEMEIIVQQLRFKNSDYPGCLSLKNLRSISKREYENIIYYKSIKPQSSKNMENIAATILDNPIDTIYIWIFNRIDLDTMSCDEYEKNFPLKKEWKVTVADMEACDWYLVYTPED